MLTILEPDYSSPAWECLPGTVRAEVRDLLSILRAAPTKGLTKWLQEQAVSCGMGYSTLRRKYDDLANNGGDWKVLVNKAKAPEMRAELSLARQQHFAAELVKMVESYQRKNKPAFRALKVRWRERMKPIPGYESWPGWPKLPAGWSDRNLADIVEKESNRARMQSVRVGTSSKTNPFLPTVLTTRTNLWPGAVTQLDDVWHRNTVTLGKKRELVNVLELGALDLYSANRFHFGAKPRRKRDNGTYETLGAADMRLFLAGMYHRFGYSPLGNMLMSEHNTAKVSEDIARTLYDATRGMVRVDYQPIEGKQAALTGFWHGTEGGNFRAKACLESTHNLIHNDLAHLAMQTGHYSHGLKGPVTTDRIVKYIEKILKDVAAKCPGRLELLKLPTLDFHSQFYPFLIDYYQHGLNGRTDHQLEGWEELGYVINEYTTIPGSDQFFDEETFLKLPIPSQIAISNAAKADPESWSRRRKLSPNEVYAKRGKFLPMPPVVLCDMIGQDLAREVTARSGFLTFADEEIAAVPLVYTARYCSGPNKGREIGHGEVVKMFALPFDDTTALVVDAKDRFLGEVPLYQRVTPINPDAFGSTAPYEQRPDIRSDALKKAAGEKHERIAAILEPSRILHADEVQKARDLREHNNAVTSGAPVTEAEIDADRTHRRAASSAAAFGRAMAKNRIAAPGADDDLSQPEDWSSHVVIDDNFQDLDPAEDWTPAPRTSHPTEVNPTVTESW